METPKPRPRLEVSVCDSGWQRVIGNCARTVLYIGGDISANFLYNKEDSSTRSDGAAVNGDYHMTNRLKKWLALITSGALTGSILMTCPVPAATAVSVSSDAQNTGNAAADSSDGQSAGNAAADSSDAQNTGDAADVSDDGQSTANAGSADRDSAEISGGAEASDGTESADAEFPDGAGYLVTDYDTNAEAAESVDSGDSTLLKASAVPAAYPSSDIQTAAAYLNSRYPAARNQGPTNTCWAYTVIAQAEFDAISSGVSQKGTTTDYSDLALAYSTYATSFTDPLGGLNDTLTLNGGSWSSIGGSIPWALLALSRWTGVSDESLLPDSSLATSLKKTLTSDEMTNDELHLKDFYLISRGDGSDGYEEVKQAILKLGGVCTSLCYRSSYLNKTNNAYYCTETTPNHAVEIVGWNDNFASTNFSRLPSGNGAWLCRNSYGTGFGTDGYFWISYYDASLADTLYTADYETATQYDNNYQYDGSYGTTGMTYRQGGKNNNVSKAANIFKAKRDAETLGAIGIYLPANVETCTVTIYTNLTDAANPESGSKVSQITTKPGSRLGYAFSGYYQIPLSTRVYLSKGETFSVVVSITGVNGNEVALQRESKGSDTSGTVKYTAVIEEGQSFLAYSNSWVDMKKFGYDGNLRVKAFTTTSTTGTPAFTDVSRSSSYYQAISWAREYGITNGKTDTLFGPNDTITRGQMVAFLYRYYVNAATDDENGNMFGTDQTYTEPFTDVSDGDTFAKQIAWAYGNGITSGTTDTTFSADDPVTRAQVVTFLYRAAQKFGSTDNLASVSFKDVPNNAENPVFYYEPLRWGVGNQITSGFSDGTFGPGKTCTRAQGITFLYRAAQAGELATGHSLLY